MVKQSSFAKFDETVEVAVRLGVDPRHADQIVRGTVVLPAGTGKSVRVLVIAVGEKAAGGTGGRCRLRGQRVPAEDQGRLDRLRRDDRNARPDGTGWPARSDTRSARPDAQSEGRHGHLGRRRARCRESKAGKIEFRVDKAGNVHAAIGKVSFGLEALEQNFARVHGPDRPRQAVGRQGRLRPQRVALQHHGARRPRGYHSVPVNSDETD